MLPRLLTIWENIRTGLWALPVAMIAVAAALAIIAVGIPIDVGANPVWFLYSGAARDAADFLSNLVGAMITLATLAISITMVVLTLAAQQLGPRLIRIFMSDLRTQAMLGLFLSTAIYLLIVMRSVYGDTVPNLAVTIGTALVFLSAIMLLVFVHHLARSIVSDNVIAHVGAEIDHSAKRLLPDKDAAVRPDEPPPEGSSAPIHLACEGYIQAMDYDALVEAAVSANAVVSLDVRPGHLLIAGKSAGTVWPAEAATPEIEQAIAGGMIVGRERVAVQDIEFSIRQLVEIGARALSPGINDPYTAMVTIDRLTLSVAHIMLRGPAKQRWHDGEGKLRLLVHDSHFDGLMDASFNMIRQYGNGSAAILIRLAERLSDLYALADEEQRGAIRRHLAMVLRAGRRSLPEPNDVTALESRVPESERG